MAASGCVGNNCGQYSQQIGPDSVPWSRWEITCPQWGSNVPEDHKLWSTADKVTLGLFPSLDVGKIMLRLETVNYRLSALLNITQNTTEAIREELTALRRGGPSE